MHNLIHDGWIFRQCPDLSFILLCKSEASHLIMGLDDVIRFQHGGKDRKAIFVVQLATIIVAIDGCDFDLFSRLGGINQVCQQNHFTMARESPCRNRAR